MAQLRVLGGAMASAPVEATAFAHRGSTIMANVACFFDGPADKPIRQAWVDQFATACASGTMARQVYLGSTWDRLVQVKARYDPANLFHHNHNIPTAIQESGQ